MSADNGVYILRTKSRYKSIPNGMVPAKLADPSGPEEIIVYRVAHAMAIDNLDWYRNNQYYNLGSYLQNVWGRSERYESEEKLVLKLLRSYLI